MADLLFRAVVSPSDLVLQAAMEIGRLAEPNNFHRAFSKLAVGGDEARILVCRGVQFPSGCQLRERAEKMAPPSIQT